MTSSGGRLLIRGGLAASLVTVLQLVRATGLPAQAGTGTLSGRITDSRSGLPLAGTTIQVQGTRLAAASGDDGRYRLSSVPAGPQTVIVLRIGYTSVRRSVSILANQTVTLDLTLQASAISLEEIVVTGTPGGEQRRSLGNSVVTIDAVTALERSAAPNLTSLLNARAPGTIITPGSGRVGAGPTIQVRGRSTLSLSAEPIVYIDGVRVNSATNQGPSGAAASSFGAQNSQVASRLNDINPEDIESIEIIKGPAASTIYGTEAANGVVQIITKKGSGPAKWTLTVQQGAAKLSDPAGRIPTNFFKDAQGNVVSWNGWKQEVDSGRPFFHTGHTQSYSVSVAGGREQLGYYVSGTYDSEKGIEPNNSFRNFSTHANLSIAPSSHINIESSLNYVRSSLHLGADNGVSPLFSAILGHSLRNPTSRGFYLVPPEVPQRLYDNAQEINRFTGGATLNHRPIDWFSHRLVLGLDFTSDDSRALERFATPDLAPFLAPLGGAAISGGRIGQTLRNNTFVTADYSGTGKFKLSRLFSSSTSVGANFVRKQLKSSFLSALNFPAPGLETVSSGTLPQTPQQSLVVNTTVGLWGQEQIGFNDRVYVTAALRVDNNSAFGDQFDWVTYPKLSGSWVISEEPFWNGLRGKVNTLKLRAAYGQSGQQPDAFAALRTFTSAGRANGDAGVTPGSFGNADLKPERGTEIEAGFEADLFNRLSLDFTWFRKRTKDAILQQPTAPSGGFPGNQVVNIGEVSNHGIELQATFQALAKRDLAWEVSANLGTNHDEVEDLGALPFAGTTNIRSVVGHPINGYWSRRVVSADRDPTTNAITNVLCDGGATGTPVACAGAPEVFIGTQTPKVVGAFTTNLTLWQRLTLYGLVDFKRGHKLYDANLQLRCGTLAELCDAFYNPQNYETLFLASITPASRSANIIAPFVESASFFRLGEVSLTYQLPSQWLGPLGVSGARISLSGRNLHVWTKYKGLDPEARAGVTDQAITPPLRRFAATVQLTF